MWDYSISALDFMSAAVAVGFAPEAVRFIRRYLTERSAS